MVYGQILGAMATDGILYIVICLMSAKLCNLLPGIAAIVGQLVMAAIWASCAHKWYYKTFPPQKTAVVYDVRHGMEKLINEYGLSRKYDVQVTLSVSECLADLSILDGMETVFVSGVHSHERNIILKHCVGKGINMFVIPRVGDVIMSGAWPMHMFHLPMLRVGRYMASPEFLFIKRAMDIVISLVALIILSPLFLITAIAVKSDGGPAVYKQVRLTEDGKQFEILKFRSMRVDAEKDGKDLSKILRQTRAGALCAFLFRHEEVSSGGAHGGGDSAVLAEGDEQRSRADACGGKDFLLHAGRLLSCPARRTRRSERA